jgi:hypothetical protein|tara:strand:- start:736 stop:975 length:240 start_codon:yes stop_codon:yes gene_type:complete
MSTNQINLHYIRAAIKANTGIDLEFDQVKKYLVEEKLITQAQANKIKILKNYNDYYEDFTCSKSSKSSEDNYETQSRKS